MTYAEENNRQKKFKRLRKNQSFTFFSHTHSLSSVMAEKNDSAQAKEKNETKKTFIFFSCDDLIHLIHFHN